MFFFPFVDFFFLEKNRTGKAFQSAKFCSLDRNTEQNRCSASSFFPLKEKNNAGNHPSDVQTTFPRAREWCELPFPASRGCVLWEKEAPAEGGNADLQPVGLWTLSKWGTLGWGEAWHHREISRRPADVAPCLLGWFVAPVFRKRCRGSPNACLSSAVWDSECLGTSCCASQCCDAYALCGSCARCPCLLRKVDLGCKRAWCYLAIHQRYRQRHFSLRMTRQAWCRKWGAQYKSPSSFWHPKPKAKFSSFCLCFQAQWRVHDGSVAGT